MPLAMAVPHIIAFRVAIRLRKSAANLPDAKLAAFLQDTVLVKSSSCILPMIFLIFEAMKCVVEGSHCEDAINSSM